MIENLAQRTSTVTPPHTAEDTKRFFESDLALAPASDSSVSRSAKQPWFSSPKRNPWERDHGLDEIIAEAALSLAAQFSDGDKIGPISDQDVVLAFEKVTFVNQATLSKKKIILTLSYKSEKPAININSIRRKAEESLIHLTS